MIKEQISKESGLCGTFDIDVLHHILLGMLIEFDRVCKKYEIHYSLFAGSALGAVRHGGFIPWDDDLDILMMRDDYERFLEKGAAELAPEYFLQKEFSAHWPMFFSKLRKNGTAYMEKMHLKDRYQHQGIYIDIFPCDNLSDNRIKRKLQYYLSKAVIASSLGKRGYLTDSMLKKTLTVLCRAIPQKVAQTFVIDRKENQSEYVHTFFGASSKYGKSVYKREYITELTEMSFCGIDFPVFTHYDEILTILYGDYMTMPSEDERACKSHALLVDFDSSYENYIDWQNSQKIDTYTISIR